MHAVSKSFAAGCLSLLIGMALMPNAHCRALQQRDANVQQQFDTALLQSSRAAECAYRAAQKVIERVSKRMCANSRYDSSPESESIVRALAVSKAAVEQSATVYFFAQHRDSFTVVAGAQSGTFYLGDQKFVALERNAQAGTAPVAASEVAAMADAIENGADLPCSISEHFNWDSAELQHYSILQRDYIARTGCQRSVVGPQQAIAEYWLPATNDDRIASIDATQVASAPTPDARNDQRYLASVQ